MHDSVESILKKAAAVLEQKGTLLYVPSQKEKPQGGKVVVVVVDCDTSGSVVKIAVL